MLGNLDHAALQDKWSKRWEEDGIYRFDRHDRKRPTYVIDTPPPFPTGEFHAGNVLNWGYFDFVARYKRMRGFNVLMPQGWDCHGFPTEVKVEKKYGRLPRDEFIKKCLEWTDEVIGTMKPQMKLLGYSIDWKSEYYTTHSAYIKAVQKSLIDMHEKGFVYRASHPVLWCTHCRSAIAKAESEEQERETVLNYIVFKTTQGGELLVATTRPEMLNACVGVFVHPSDERHKALVGKKVKVPIFNREVPVMEDADVDKEFGTGAVMICTFGDRQDVVWAYRHKLPVIEAMDGHGRMKNAGKYDGMKAEEARKEILGELQAQGLLKKQEKLSQVVKIHDRCKKTIEMLPSTQWFIKLSDSKEMVLKKSAEMRWIPEHMRQLLVDWTEGLEWDWCISRQRYFGVPIPFWYCEKCGTVYPAKELPAEPSKDKPPVSKCKCGGALVGETSVCDGWVDSSITPLIIAGWPDNFDARLYPSDMRPQGTDIIRTWAFYTIFRCSVLTGEKPFREMLINGMVCGSDGKKMSKSLGNYVEAKDVIAKASVDALRQWVALSGSTGKDNIFYWKDVNYAQSFLTKLWNASKFVEKALEGYDGKEGKKHVTDKWMEARLNETVRSVTKSMDGCDFYGAITSLYNFFWHDFCDFYLEDVKYRVYGADAESKKAAQATLKRVLAETLRMLAPFACYTSEEIHREMFDKKKSVHVSKWPIAAGAPKDEALEKIAAALHEIVAQARRAKAAKGMALNAEVETLVVQVPEALLAGMGDVEEDVKGITKAKALEFRSGEEICASL